MSPLKLHPDRLFPADATTRDIARRLYAEVADLPIISPHGHTDPQWFADNQPFTNAAELLLTPTIMCCGCSTAKASQWSSWA